LYQTRKGSRSCRHSPLGGGACRDHPLLRTLPPPQSHPRSGNERGRTGLSGRRRLPRLAGRQASAAVRRNPFRLHPRQLARSLLSTVKETALCVGMIRMTVVVRPDWHSTGYAASKEAHAALSIGEWVRLVNSAVEPSIAHDP